MGNTLYELNKKVEYLYCKMKSCGQEDPSLPFGEWTEVPLTNGVSLYYFLGTNEQWVFNLAESSLTFVNEPGMPIVIVMGKENPTEYDWTDANSLEKLIYFDYSFEDGNFNLPYKWMGEDFEENGSSSTRMLQIVIDPVLGKSETTEAKIPAPLPENELNISFIETESGFNHDLKLIITP